MNTTIRKQALILLFLTTLLLPFAEAYSAIDKVKFQVIKKPEIPLPPQTTNILITDYFVSPKNHRYHKSFYNSYSYIDKVNIDTLLSSSALDGFRSVVNDAAIYQLNSRNVYACKGDTSLCRFPMSRKNALDIMAADSTKVMFALHNIDVVDVLNMDFQYPYYIATYIVYYVSNWKRYNLATEKYQNYDFKSDTIRYTGIGYSEENAIASIPDRYTALSYASFVAGQKFANLVTPHWEYVERPYYTIQTPELEKATNHFKRKEIDQATAIWRKYANSKDVAPKIAYNMAVACEMLDRLDLALEWINTSIKLKSNKQNNRYKAILQNRIEETKAIRGE